MAERSIELLRPLVAIDLETTGLNAQNDRIVELSCIKLLPSGEREVRTRRLNPGIPIAAEATAVHGISDADVAHEPSFAHVAKGLLAFLSGCDLTGFNIEGFDLPMLKQEFERAGLAFPDDGVHVIDSWRIYLRQEPRDLSHAYAFYCGKPLEGAHGAEVDARAAADILLAQLERYPEVPTAIAALADFCHPQHPDWIDPDGRIVWRGDQAALGFGKHRDRPLEVLAKEAPDYLRWMANADFSAEVHKIVKAALKGEFPVRKAG